MIASKEKPVRKKRDKPQQQQQHQTQQNHIQDEEFVTDPAFRLQFLRAEKFVAKAAAERLIRYMEEKKSLFGSDALIRKIQINKDFHQEGDLECLECGYLQLLPGRDRAGRAVIIGLLKLKKFRTIDNIVRVLLTKEQPEHFRCGLVVCFVCSV